MRKQELYARISAPLSQNVHFRCCYPAAKQFWLRNAFFIVHINDEEISTEAWSDHERLVINDYHWWTPDELEKTTDVIFPENISAILSESEKTRR